MFGFGEKRFVGIDIGTANVKIVELKMNVNKPVLVNYAWMSLDSLEKKKDPKSSYFDVVLPEYLKRMLKEAGIGSRQVYLSIPSFGGLVTIIKFPAIEKKELDQAVMFEAKKYIPMSLDDVVLSWDVVKKGVPKRLSIKNAPGDSVEITDNDEKKESAGDLEVLLVAAPKDKIAKYEQLASDADLKIKLIEIESFSLVRSLVGEDQGNFVIVDIGARVCNIILVEKGIIKVNRNMDAGGKDITKTIARSMNVDGDRAEKLKTTDNNFLSAESNIKFPVVDLIAGEVARVIKTYYGDEAQSSIDAIILSGGSAKFSGLAEHFSKTLDIKTIIGNSLGRVEYDQRLEPRISEIGSFFSVAIGLALSGTDEYLKK